MMYLNMRYRKKSRLPNSLADEIGLAASDRATWKVSVPSSCASSLMGIVNVFCVSPAAKSSLPIVVAKS